MKSMALTISKIIFLFKGGGDLSFTYLTKVIHNQYVFGAELEEIGGA